MRNTFNINFLCRPSKVTKSGLAPIEMSIIINGERAIITLPMKADPKKFQQLITSKRTNPIKEFTQLTYEKVIRIESDLLREGISVTPLTIKERFSNGYTISDLFNDFLKIQKKRIGVDLTAKVYRKYEIVRDLFFKSVNPDKQVTEITNAVISDFYAELNQSYEPTTSAGMMTKLKTVIRFGIDNNRLKINPFNRIKISKKQKEVEYLTESEIKSIINKDMVDRLSKVRDLFIFQCFTGLSFSDMAHLTREDIQSNGNQLYIKKRRMKTEVEYTTVLFKEAEQIIKKYDYKLPIISNQKMNGYLKEIGDICGITKPLHSHIARHSFATMCLNRGLSLEIVAKMLGHSNTKMTSHYAKLIDKTVFEAVNQIKRD